MPCAYLMMSVYPDYVANTAPCFDVRSPTPVFCFFSDSFASGATHSSPSATGCRARRTPRACRLASCRTAGEPSLQSAPGKRLYCGLRRKGRGRVLWRFFTGIRVVDGELCGLLALMLRAVVDCMLWAAREIAGYREAVGTICKEERPGFIFGADIVFYL